MTSHARSQEEPPEVFIEDIEDFHYSLLEDLSKSGQKFVERFLQCARAGDQKYTFNNGSELPMVALLEPGDDGETRVIHLILDKINNPDADDKVDKDAATSLIRYLVRANETMISARNAGGRSPLYLAFCGFIGLGWLEAWDGKRVPGA